MADDTQQTGKRRGDAPGPGCETGEDPCAQDTAAASTSDRQDGVLRIYPPRGGTHEGRLYDAAVRYARGDFGSARRLAAQVMAAPHSEEEASFATQILHRTALDPVALLVALGCFGLFWLIVYLTLWR